MTAPNTDAVERLVARLPEISRAMRADGCPSWARAIDKAAATITAQAARIAELEAELRRRSENEIRNCINYAPCSGNDGRMEQP